MKKFYLRNLVLVLGIGSLIISCQTGFSSRNMDDGGSTFTSGDGSTSYLDGEAGSSTSWTLGSDSASFVDSDGDGYYDSLEETYGTDPNDANDTPSAAEGVSTLRTMKEYFDENSPEESIANLEAKLAEYGASPDSIVLIVEPRRTTTRNVDAEIVEYLDGNPFEDGTCDEEGECADPFISFLQFEDNTFRMFSGESKEDPDSAYILEGEFFIFDGFMVMLNTYGDSSYTPTAANMFAMSASSYGEDVSESSVCDDGTEIDLEGNVSYFYIYGKDVQAGYNFGGSYYSKTEFNECFSDGNYQTIEELLTE
ncbi:MAG: thrombospondin type 3 repeat-containing protein [Pseudomonadota bacterium]